MTNVVPLHAPKDERTQVTATLDDFIELLKLDELTVKGEKGRVKTWKDISLNSLHLTTLAMDPISVHNDQMYFASTFEGAAALCTQILVHDIPELSAFGATLYDGHMLYVSLSEFNTRINNKNACTQWLRNGCGANAAYALGMEYETQWTAVDPQNVREILHAPEIDLFWWHADPQHDAYRYFSAIQQLCAPLDKDVPHVETCDLSKGYLNEEWQSVLNAWNAFHQSSAWNTRLTQKDGIQTAGRLLGEMLNTITQQNLEERFIQLVLRTFTPHLDNDEAVKIAPVVAEILKTKRQIMRLVDGLVAINKPLEYAHDYQNTNIWRTSLTYAWYGRFLDTQDQRDQAIALAAAISSSGKNENQFRALLNSLDCTTFTHEQLNVLSQTEAHVVPWNQYTADNGMVLNNLLSDYKYLLAQRKDTTTFTPSNYMQNIIDLIDNGWLGFNSDLKIPQVQKMWTDAFMMTEQGYSDDPDVAKKVPLLLSTTQRQAPDFASHLFISLLHHKNYSLLMTARTTKMLFDAGANWNTALYEKTLAQEVVDCDHMPITLKIEARRAIQEHNRNKTVVQLVKKL